MLACDKALSTAREKVIRHTKGNGAPHPSEPREELTNLDVETSLHEPQPPQELLLQGKYCYASCCLDGPS